MLGFVMLSFALLSCTKTKQIEYSDAQFQFQCPEGWEISEIQKDCTYSIITVEPENWFSEGVMYITTFPYSTDLSILADDMKKEIAAQHLYKISGLKLGKTFPKKFQQYDALEFGFALSKSELEGKLICFNVSDGLGVSVFQQGGKTDVLAFAKIKQSFLFK